jgi:hypothetical protein
MPHSWNSCWLARDTPLVLNLLATTSPFYSLRNLLRKFPRSWMDNRTSPNP